jgi:TonB family protein
VSPATPSAQEPQKNSFATMKLPCFFITTLALAVGSSAGAQEAPAVPAPAASAPAMQPLARTRTVSLRPADPSYPEALHSKGVQGLVEVRATLGADGKPTDLVVLNSSRSQALDDAGLALVKRLQFAIKAPAEGASSPAIPNATQVVVPVEFFRDSLGTLSKKTCAEFGVDVAYHRATFPEQQVGDMSVIKMTIGAMVLGGFQRTGPSPLVALAKKSKSAARDIAEACATSPERLFLEQFKELMDKSPG